MNIFIKISDKFIAALYYEEGFRCLVFDTNNFAYVQNIRDLSPTHIYVEEPFYQHDVQHQWLGVLLYAFPQMCTTYDPKEIRMELYKTTHSIKDMLLSEFRVRIPEYSTENYPVKYQLAWADALVGLLYYAR